MEGTKSFEELKAWQKAHQLTLTVYRYTDLFPKREDFCLTSQFRRAAISVSANIAEGYKKRGKADKLRFFNMAQGSLEECRYYIILSTDLKYIDKEGKEELLNKLGDTSRLLNGYCKAISDDIL